jgi:ParB-like chromosome segregation protein Spo0J
VKTLTWKTEKRKISDLVPYEKNPRKLSDKQAEDLKASLEKFNLVELPAINQDNKIIAGHQRIKILALIKSPDTEIEVRVPSRLLTQEEYDEYLIRSNKNTGDWDWDMLKDFDMESLENWGFTKEELNYLNEPEAKMSDDSEENKAEADTMVIVGGYRTSISKDRFKAWEEMIAGQVGFNRDDIINEIFDRLEL